MHNDIEARIARWRAFLRPDAEPGFLFRVSYTDAEAPAGERPRPWPQYARERLERAWQDYEQMRKQAAIVPDDSIPYLQLQTGTEIFAAAFGCQVEYPLDTNPFALPCVHTPQQADALRVPDLGSSSLAYLFDLADELQQRAGDQAIFRLVDIQSPMDIAALIWNKEELMLAMVEAPDAVRDLAAKVRHLLTAFLDEWFRRYGTGYVAHFPDYFMDGGMTLSEDEIGAVSTEMFRTFFRDELVALSQRYGGIGIHCCADARHQWQDLCSLPALRLLNLVRPPNRDESYVTDAYDFFGNCCAHMHMGAEAPQPDALPPGCRLVLTEQVETQDAAIARAEELRRWRDS